MIGIEVFLFLKSIKLKILIELKQTNDMMIIFVIPNIKIGKYNETKSI